MTLRYALIPVDASRDELLAGGIDPDAQREVPGTGFVHSDAISVWVGVDPVVGVVDLNGAADGPPTAWVQETIGDQVYLANATRLAVVRLD